MDPLAKYFHLNLSQTGIAPRQPLIPESSKPTIQHVLNDNGSGISIGDWNITGVSQSRISGETQIEALRSSYPDELDFPFPEMLFSENYLRMEYSTTTVIECNVIEALRGCKFAPGSTPDRRMVKVMMADKWEKRRDQDGNVIKTWREDYDWTFTTRRLFQFGIN